MRYDPVTTAIAARPKTPSAINPKNPPTATGTGATGVDPWTNWLNTDPGYLGALAAEQAGQTSYDAQDRAARERAFVQFGDPSLVSGNVNPLTAAMAQQATSSGISTLAGLQRTRDLNQQTATNNLAGRGLLSSGDYGYQMGQVQSDYGRALYAAQQGVLDTLASSARDTAQQMGKLHSGVVDALTQGYSNYVQNPQFWGGTTGAGGATGAGTPTKKKAVAAPAKPRPAPLQAAPVRKPLPNPYTTGRKRYG